MDFTLYLGTSRMGAELTWSGASNSHLFVSGQSGTGKSCFLKHCIRLAAATPSSNGHSLNASSPKEVSVERALGFYVLRHKLFAMKYYA